MELLDIVDDNGLPTGQTIERAEAHQRGAQHRTAHVWLLRRQAGKTQVLLQRRSQNKDSYPGCYDISSAGHIPAGMDFLTSALRELQEELGLTAQAEELIFCAQRRFEAYGFFQGQPYLDRQVSNIYALWRNIETRELTLQTTELDDVRWLDWQDCLDLVRLNQAPHCIRLEELILLDAALGGLT